MMKLTLNFLGVYVGLFDPEKTTQDFLWCASDQAEAYMTVALLAQHDIDNEYILAPCIQGLVYYYWINLFI